MMLWTQLMLDQDADDPFELLATTVLRYPDNQELRLQYARLLGSEGNYTGAQAQFVLLLKRDPENTELLSTAALLDFELEYFDEALSKFQQLIALGERLDEAHYYVGRIEMASDRYPEAIVAFASVGPSREFRDAKALAAQLLIDTAFASDIKTFFDYQRRAYPSAAEQLTCDCQCQAWRPSLTLALFPSNHGVVVGEYWACSAGSRRGQSRGQAQPQQQESHAVRGVKRNPPRGEPKTVEHAQQSSSH